MNFLNFFSLENKPLLKYTIITLLVVNCLVLAFLLFGPKKSTVTNGQDRGNASASPSEGFTIYSGPQEETSASDDSIDEEDTPEEEGSGLSDDAGLQDGEEEGSGPASAANTDAAAEEAGTEEDEDSDLPDMPASGPLLELTNVHVTLRVGEEFDFYRYIKTMIDRDGSDLSRYIHITGNVDTRTPGDYTITYRITSQIDGEYATRDLLVTVEE